MIGLENKGIALGYIGIFRLPIWSADHLVVGFIRNAKKNSGIGGITLPGNRVDKHRCVPVLAKTADMVHWNHKGLGV